MHLALTDDASSMRVSWTTGGASQSPSVRFRQVTAEVGEEAQNEIDAATWQVSQTGGFIDRTNLVLRTVLDLITGKISITILSRGPLKRLFLCRVPV